MVDAAPSHAPGSRTKPRDLRSELLRAAEQEIAANGPAKATLRGIATRCGVSHQASAHHFVDRAGLFTALATEGFEKLTALVTAAASDAPSEGGTPVAAIGIAYVRFAEEQSTVFDVMYRPDLLHAHDPAFLTAKWRLWEVVMSEVVAAQERGWAKHVPADVLTLTCWSSTHGLAAVRRDLAQMPAGGVGVDLGYERVIEIVTEALNSK